MSRNICMKPSYLSLSIIFIIFIIEKLVLRKGGFFVAFFACMCSWSVEANGPKLNDETDFTGSVPQHGQV